MRTEGSGERGGGIGRSSSTLLNERKIILHSSDRLEARAIERRSEGFRGRSVDPSILCRGLARDTRDLI
jgi:hypothetical protein